MRQTRGRCDCELARWTLGLGYRAEKCPLELLRGLKAITRIHGHGFFNDGRHAPRHPGIAFPERGELGIVHGARQPVLRDDASESSVKSGAE
jgi:hypothetical protein